MSITFKDRLVKSSLDTGWFPGFSDAEGCFYARVKIVEHLSLKQIRFWLS